MPQKSTPNDKFRRAGQRTQLGVLIVSFAALGACEPPSSSEKEPVSEVGTFRRVTAEDFPADLADGLAEVLGEEDWDGVLAEMEASTQRRLADAFDYEIPPLVAYAVRDPEASIASGTVEARLRIASQLALGDDGGASYPLPLLRDGDPDGLRSAMIRRFFERAGVDPANEAQASAALLDKVTAVDAFIAADAEKREKPEARFLDWALKATTLTAFAAKIGLLTDQLIGTFEMKEVPASRPFRLLVIGPGIDLVNQHLGALAPVATYQPWETALSVIRHGWVEPEQGLEIHTLEINPEIQRHLEAARDRADKGVSYPGALFRFASSSDLHREAIDDYLTNLLAPVASWPGAELLSMGDARSLRVELTESYRETTTEEEATRSRNRSQLRWFRCQFPPRLVQSLRPALGDIVGDHFAPTAFFDLVVCTNVLRYYEDPALAFALANVARVLRPGGCFITTYPRMNERSRSVGLEWVSQASMAGWDSQFLLRRR